MKCVHTFGTDRHKRQADITFVFEYIMWSQILYMYIQCQQDNGELHKLSDMATNYIFEVDQKCKKCVLIKDQIHAN